MTWYYDQWITTHGLLYKRICTVPPWSGLWNKKGLEFDPFFDDSEQCWHGRGFKDCNLEIHIVPHGCKWYHFFPEQPFQGFFQDNTNQTWASVLTQNQLKKSKRR